MVPSTYLSLRHIVLLHPTPPQNSNTAHPNTCLSIPPPPTPPPTPPHPPAMQGYGAKYIQEYVGCSTGADAFNVGEVWVDLKWQGGELAVNQDGARQALCDWVDGHQGHAAAFDFVTKGVLQVEKGWVGGEGASRVGGGREGRDKGGQGRRGGAKRRGPRSPRGCCR